MTTALLVLFGLAGLLGGCAGTPGTVDTDPAQPLRRDPAGLVLDYPWYESWRDLVTEDALVVRGTVTKQREFTDEERDLPATMASVRVSQVAAEPASGAGSGSGSAPAAAGATIEVRHIPQAAGAPQIETGGEYVFVLVPYGETSGWQFPSPIQSIYPVMSGTAHSLADNPLRLPADVATALGVAAA